MYLMQTWGDVFTASLQSLWLGFVSIVPGLLIAIIIFLIGWVLASVVGKAFMQVIDAVKLNKVFESAGLGDVVSRAGYTLNIGKFIGELVRWFIILVFLVTALDILGLSQVTQFLREVVLGYLPQVIVAAFMIMIAAVLSEVARKFITGSARAASVKTASMLGTIAYYAIWIFGFIIALSQLGIAQAFMQILFAGIVAMLALAGGLAFGLGGRDAAARAIESIKNDLK